MTTSNKKLNSAIPNVLTIAGSDSGGGAGIQADIKAISANGAFAASALTAITAQNTQGVTAVHDVPIDMIAAQIDAVMSDLNIAAIKIGMLSRPEVIRLVAEKIDEYECRHVVLDPVMVATSGDKLLLDESVEVLKTTLIPKVCVVTPNLHEAAILSGSPVARTQKDMQSTAQELAKLGAKAVLLKGGHLDGHQSGDLLLDGAGEEHWLLSERINTQNTHGTGCTLSSALAAFLAKGESLPTAASLAKAYIHASIESANDLTVGQGSGPLHHFHAFY